MSEEANTDYLCTKADANGLARRSRRKRQCANWVAELAKVDILVPCRAPLSSKIVSEVLEQRSMLPWPSAEYLDA